MIRLDSVCGSSPALEKLTGVLCHTFPHSGQIRLKTNFSVSEQSIRCSRMTFFTEFTLLLPARFSKFTITTPGIQIHCMIMYFDGISEKYIICLVRFAAFSSGFLWKIHMCRKMSRRFACVLKNKKDREATSEEACCPCLFQGGENNEKLMIETSRTVQCRFIFKAIHPNGRSGGTARCRAEVPHGSLHPVFDRCWRCVCERY